MDHFDLNFEGKAGREPVDVDFIGGDPLWFQEDLMFWFVGEPDVFVFNARTITGSDALNDSGVHRGLVQILQDDLPGAIGGMGDVAGFLTAMSCQDGSRRVRPGRKCGTSRAMFHVEQWIVPEVFLPISEPGNRFIPILGLSSGEIDGLTD